jgi:hypothetical protein
VEVLNKEQKALLERAIDKFIIDNKMCPKEITSTTKNHQRIHQYRLKEEN